MAVAAKFYVASITRHSYNKGAAQVVLQVVSRGEENKEWASATPAGKVELSIGNPDAVAQFQKAFEEGTDVPATFFA